MPGTFGDPYRSPCGGWPASARRWLRNHSRNSEKVPVWENISALRDYDALASYIDPYPILFKECDTGSCVTVACATDQSEGTQPCYPIHLDDGTWDFWNRACAAAAGETVDTVDRNCYRLTSTLSARQPCRKVGFKNVLGHHYWYGFLGFNNECECDPYSPTQTRYTRLVARYELEAHDHASPGTYDLDYLCIVDGSVEIDSITGEVLRPNCQVTVTGKEYVVGVLTTDYDGTDPVWPDDPRTGGASDMEPEWMFDGNCGDESTYLQVLAGYTPAWGVIEESNVGDTNRSYRVSGAAAGFTGEVEVRVSYRLEGSSPFNDALEQTLALLGQVDLSDDVRYPWRTDDWGSVGPVVRFDAAPPQDPRGYIGTACTVDDLRNPINDGTYDPFDPSWTPTYQQIAWFDPQFYRWVYAPGESSETAAATDLVPIYTGALVGALNPRGYAGHWDYGHPTYERCPDGPDEPFCTASYGARSGANEASDPTDAVVPASATRWTDNVEAGSRRPGAFIEVTGTVSGGEIWVQKWAETLLPWESINFARPCGIDRGRLWGDDANSECVSSGSGSPLNVILEADTAGVITNDVVLCYDTTSGADGIYQVTRNGAGNYDLTTKLHDIPAWMDTYKHDGLFAKLRWYDKRGICEPVNVTAATDNEDGTVSITVDADVYLFGEPLEGGGDGELLDFTDVAGLATDVEVLEVTSLTEFTVSGSLSGAYAGGGSVAVADYDADLTKWNDDNPKRDYVTRSFVENAYSGGRSWTLTETQRCMFPSACAPSVVCFSPDAETWDNGLTLAMPTSLTVDPCNGTLWVGDVLQAEADPFWNAPPRPCSGTWVEDSTADCTGDHARRPMVEPRLTLPAIDAETAPTLVTGVTLHTAASAAPNIEGVGHASGESSPRGSGLVHTLWLAVEDAAASDSGCGFQTDYTAWWRGC